MTQAKTPTPEHMNHEQADESAIIYEAFRRVFGPTCHPSVVLRALKGNPEIKRAVDKAYQQIMDEREAAREQAEVEQSHKDTL